MKRKSNIIYGEFNMGQIDEVSSKLGGIEETQKLILRSLHTIESAYNDMREKVILHGASNEAMWKIIDNHGPRIESLEDTEHQRLGAWKLLCMIGTAIAAVGGFIGAWLSKILGLV